MYRISVITINLNNKEGLERTIFSVVHQTLFAHMEYIVIDGGSTDGSLDVIRDNERYLTHWLSEQDNGIYDAMNKGIDLASGDYCIFLNSGDSFHAPFVVETVAQQLGADIVYGNLIIDGNKVKVYPDHLPKNYFRYESLPHPASFIKTGILKQKKYDASYKIVADWIFFQECLRDESRTFNHVDVVVSNFVLGGISSSMEKVEAEKKRYQKSKR